MARKNASTTTARFKVPKEGPGYNPTVIAIVAVCVIIVLVIVLRGGEEEEQPPPVPTRAPQPVAKAEATPAPSSSSSTSYGFDDLGTPTPTPPPTPSIKPEACVNFRWTANFQPNSDQALPITVTLSNSCSMDLQSLNLTFEGRGFRGDEMTASARGTFSGGLNQGQSSELTITLPATAGGYERIDLQPVSGL